jgi:hypothetical protein
MGARRALPPPVMFRLPFITKPVALTCRPGSTPGGVYHSTAPTRLQSITHTVTNAHHQRRVSHIWWRDLS